MDQSDDIAETDASDDTTVPEDTQETDGDIPDITTNPDTPTQADITPCEAGDTETENTL